MYEITWEKIFLKRIIFILNVPPFIGCGKMPPKPIILAYVITEGILKCLKTILPG